MKKITFFLLAMTATLAVHAEDYAYPYLMFQTADGTKVSMAVESLQLMFKDGQLVATNGDGTQQFTLTSLSKMFFSENSAAGITDVMTDNEEVEVFNLSGMQLGTYASISDAKSVLKRGIYVFKTRNGKSIKMAVK